MTNASRTKSDSCGVEAATLSLNSSISNRRSARASARRQRWRPFGLSAATMAVALFVVGLVQRIDLANATGFGYGDPIDVVVTPGDDITLSFDGDVADAIAVSIQQCTGNRYVKMGVFYNTTTDTDEGSRLTGSQCNRIVGAGASADDSAVEYNKLCAFKNSGPVELVYTEESESLNGTAYSATVDPRELQVVITNTGSTTASVQVVLFSSDYPAPNEDSSIDRVHTRSDQDENTYTVDASFQAEGSTDTFCDEGVCAVYAYYIKIDDEDSDADLLFGTTCQARTGVMVYEGFTTVSSLADDGDDDPEAETASHGGATSADETSSHGGATSADVVDAPAKTATSTTPYDLSACTEFPTHTEATYRVYLVVSPDTATASRVGYGLRDQLLFESEEIHVEDDMDHVCPEIVTEESSGAVRTVAAPATAAATVAAAAAIALGFGGVVAALAGL